MSIEAKYKVGQEVYWVGQNFSVYAAVIEGFGSFDKTAYKTRDEYGCSRYFRESGLYSSYDAAGSASLRRALDEALTIIRNAYINLDNARVPDIYGIIENWKDGLHIEINKIFRDKS